VHDAEGRTWEENEEYLEDRTGGEAWL